MAPYAFAPKLRLPDQLLPKRAGAVYSGAGRGVNLRRSPLRAPRLGRGYVSRACRAAPTTFANSIRKMLRRMRIASRHASPARQPGKRGFRLFAPGGVLTRAAPHPNRTRPLHEPVTKGRHYSTCGRPFGPCSKTGLATTIFDTNPSVDAPMNDVSVRVVAIAAFGFLAASAGAI